MLWINGFVANDMCKPLELPALYSGQKGFLGTDKALYCLPDIVICFMLSVGDS